MTTPTELLREFRVDTGLSNVSDNQIISLSNGNFLVAWSSESGPGSLSEIHGKIYDAQGRVVRDTYRISSNSVFDVDKQRFDPDIKPTNDGGFILVYKTSSTSRNSDSVSWLRYDSAGNLINSRALGFDDGNGLFNPQVAVRSADNSSFVAYTDVYEESGVTELDVITGLLSPTGAGAIFYSGATNSEDDELINDIEILANGNLVNAYTVRDTRTSSQRTEIEFGIVTSAARRVVFSGRIPTSPAGNSDPQVAVLTNGNFVVTWQEDSPPFSVSDDDIKARIYAPTGALLSNTILVANTGDDENEPSVAALPDGGFVVAWDNDTDDELQARRFNADGIPSGSTFVVAGGDVTTPSVAAAQDGRILFSWEELGVDDSINAAIWDAEIGSSGQQIDFNKDGNSDLLWRNNVSGAAVTWYMNGANFAGSASLGVVPTDWELVGASDINKDGHSDLLWRNSISGAAIAWYMNGANFAGSASFGVVPTDWQLVGAADINKDGHSDLLWRNNVSGAAIAWYMNGANFAGSASFGVVSTDWELVGAADINKDGNSDLLWRNSVSGNTIAWYMNGANFAGSASLGVVPTDWELVGASDLNKDGNSDLLWRNSVSGNTIAWYMNGATFTGSASLGVVPTEWSLIG